MKVCSTCEKTIADEDEKILHSKIVCEDCYLEGILPKMQKAHYDNDAEFMNRLKDSYIARQQQYH